MNNSRPRVFAVPLTALLLAMPPAGAQSASTKSAPQLTQTKVSPVVAARVRYATFRLDVDEGLGTGFFISPDGLALTAYHVVFGSKHLTAHTPQGKDYAAELVGYDDGMDVALIRVKVGGSVPFLPLSAAEPKAGDAIVAIGNGDSSFRDLNVFLASKYGNVLKTGVSAFRKDFASGTLELSAVLAPGDSGGPIINTRGEAVGVASYIRPQDEQPGAADEREPNQDSGKAGGVASLGGLVLISDAVPVTSGSDLLARLRRGKKKNAPVIGIGVGGSLGNSISALPDELFPKVGLGPKPGVLFNTVVAGSPAAQAGLRPVVMVDPGDPEGEKLPTLKGDVILAIDGQDVRDFLDLLNIVRGHDVGDTVSLRVQRGNQTVDVKVTLGARAQVQRP